MNDGLGARAHILSRLRAAPRSAPPPYPAPGTAAWLPPVHGPERQARFRAMLEASRAEVYEASAADWPERLKILLAGKGVTRLLHAPGTAAGRQLADAWAGTGGPALIAYDRPVEAFKPVLVGGVEAALTTARSGIAHTGTLVLWPDADEPRLMSLLPPIHVVLIDAATVTDNLSDTISSQNWAAGMPTNALLISGPSKTADIEQTLAYGVHGPKDLIVLVITR